MRVVSEWNYKQIKVTVFHMNEKYSIKLEENLLEQTYKFRDGQVSNLSHLKSLLTEAFYNQCMQRFKSMAESRLQLFEVNDDETEFEEII
ncbi:MAG: hypothetical protein HKO66_12295 [Saprospiraceae bacterium]|nr:hypothetical protein [Bacteroidia bacterium]NNE13844.1 hypothetical protein [Saprospiraceae bacterium]NNL93010.1 hypothetical protein [Saprospiraceae bacterium]